jgi:hypothetical protein
MRMARMESSKNALTAEDSEPAPSFIICYAMDIIVHGYKFINKNSFKTASSRLTESAAVVSPLFFFLLEPIFPCRVLPQSQGQLLSK